MTNWKRLTDNVKGYGSKAVNLSRAQHIGLAVPNGIVLKHGFKPSEKELSDMLAGLQLPLIVRSSTSVEDTNLSSMAGVFTSVVIHKQAEVKQALETVTNWSKSSQVKALLKSLQLKTADVKTHVIVQEYVTAIAGGVLFTYPKRNRFSVEMSSSSTAVTDGGEVSESFDLPINGSVETELHRQLQELAQRITQEYGDAPQDIEWALDADNNLYVLQIRPQIVDPDKEVVVDEIVRLENTVAVDSQLTSVLLPDLHTPTPVTVSLLEEIYSSSGPFGLQLAKIGFQLPRRDYTFVETVFGRPYFNIKLCNDTFLKSSSKRLTMEDGVVRYASTFRGVLNSLVNPVVSIRMLILSTIQPLRIRKRTRMPMPEAPSRELEVDEVVDHLLNTLCPDIFATAGLIQMIQETVRKHIDDPADFQAITEDTSRPPWMRVATLSEDRTWYLSHDENEISSPPLKSYDKSLEVIRGSQSDSSAKTQARDAVESKIVSAWDKTIVRNLLVSLDTLQQRRSDLHDRYVQAIRILHLRLKEIDTAHKHKDAVWYASIDEICSDSLPSTQELLERKRVWQILQKQQIRSLDAVQQWSDITEPLPAQSDETTAVVLSPGSFHGRASAQLPEEGKEKGVLLTQSLSQSIIFEHQKLSGVITQHGGKLSHVAILARELGLPIIQIDSLEYLAGREVKVESVGSKAFIHSV